MLMYFYIVFADVIQQTQYISLRPWLLGLLSELCSKWVMLEIFSSCKNKGRSDPATGASVCVAHFIPSIARLCFIYVVACEVATVFYPCFTDVKTEPEEDKDTQLLVGGSGSFWLLLILIFFSSEVFHLKSPVKCFKKFIVKKKKKEVYSGSTCFQK